MILLHIGTDKAGSTAIQRFVDKNSGFLKQHGWLYPTKCVNFEYNHTKLCSELVKNNFEYLEKLKEEVQLSRLDNILISYELFYKLPEKTLQEFILFLESLNKGKVKIIIYLRRQDDKKESKILQTIKSGLSNISNLLDQKEYKKELDYYQVIEKWRKYIDKENIIIRPYSKDLLPHKHSINADFLQYAFGIDMNAVKGKITLSDYNSNPSLDAISAYVADFFSKINNGIASNILISQLLAIQGLCKKSNSHLFNSTERKNILAHYKQGNDLLIKEYEVPSQLFNYSDKEYRKPTDKEVIARIAQLYKRKDYILPLDWWGGQPISANHNLLELVYGFHKTEKWGVWTKGNEVSRLAVLVWKEIFTEHTHLNFILRCGYLQNTETVSFMRIGNNEWVEVKDVTEYKVATSNIKKDGGVVFIDFKHTNAVAPKDLCNDNNDTRIMGCSLKSISFDKSD